MIIIHVFYFICAFCLCIKSVVTIRKIHGNESFKTFHNICLDGLGQKHASLNRSVSDFPDNRNINLLAPE